MNIQARSVALAEELADAIRDFENGAYSSRGLARRVEQTTTPSELEALNNEMLSHTYWVARHLVHQPACWAPSLEELTYLYRCLTGEEQFLLEVAEGYRK
jgi:hypothetical protein